MRGFRRLAVFAAVACIAAGSGRSFAADGPTAAAPTVEATSSDAAQLDPKVDTLLHAVSDYYHSMNSMKLTAGAKLTRQLGGQTQTMQSEFNFAMQRPNRFAMIPTGADAGRWGTIVSDGKNQTIYIGQVNKYTIEDSPKTIDDLINNRLVSMLSTQVGQIVGALMTSDPYTHLMKNVQATKYLGEDTLNGQKQNHIRVQGPQVAWEGWISEGDKPQLTQIKPDLSPIEAKAKAAGQQLKLDLTIYTSDLQPNAKLGDADFAFTPPAGAEKVASFFQQPNEQKNALVGKAAPAFTLAKLDGSNMSLADHKGKDIVILDFWATWCGPCVHWMPILDSLASSYKGKHVVLYAVNLREGKDRIEAFLKQKGLDVTVLMDKNAAVARDYGVQGIPQTVIIDKAGNISAIHVGFSPDLKQTMRDELDKLLADEKALN